MIVPLPYQDKIYGYCYLSNFEVTDYFDARSQRVVSPLASQAAIAYQNFILASSKEEKVRLDAELNAARTVQDALLPTKIEVPTTQIAYFYTSASQTGGDWFHHHYDANTHRLYAFVGDVTGHGLPSALLTAVVSGAVLSHLKRESDNSDKTPTSMQASLYELAEIANYAVFSAGSRSSRFMTMCFACLDLNSGELVVVSAGHTPPYVFKKTENKVISLPCSGSLLGFSEAPKFDSVTHMLTPGDSVLLYTDGLLENTNQSGVILTSRSLRKFLTQEESPAKCVETLSTIVESAAKEQPLEDDVTVYMFRWDGVTVPQLEKAG
jgi:serine phosphatase RsbU (regulator of sigma subunit)